MEKETSARDLRSTRHTKSTKVPANETKVETVTEEEEIKEEERPSAISELKIRDLPIPEELPAMDKDLPYYVPPSDKPYEVPITDGMLNFVMDKLKTDATVEKNLHPEDMITRTFLMPPMDGGTHAQAKILKRIDAYRDAAKYHPDMVKFKCIINDKFEEVVAYNDIADYIEAAETQDGIWRFEEILDHQGPLHPKHKDYTGSSYNVLIRWTNGEIDWQPLKNLQGHDKTTVALYANKHGLLELPG